VNDFSGWIPMRIYWQGSRPMVDWGHLGAHRFSGPFFAQTINRCRQHPADVLFRHQTPLEELGEIAAAQTSLRPTGFIYHMSRCGSTLISQMLAASPENIVVSEAAPVDTILRAHFHDPAITEELRGQWLQWLVGVLAWRRQPVEKNMFIKFDPWHTLFLPLIQRVFPDVPWIFVYREPLEVMVSHLGHRGGQMIPGVLEPGLFGWDPPTVGSMPLNEYGARALAKICEAALTQIQSESKSGSGRGKLVNYRQLPESVWPALMDHWQVKFAADETARMMAVAKLNAKNPVLPFEPDSAKKNAAATTELRAVTHHWLDGAYQKLEGQRQSQGFA
jgi:hypothetical protein